MFPTTYIAEKVYLPYLSANTRPALSAVPSTLYYGEDMFDIILPESSYSESELGNTATR